MDLPDVNHLADFNDLVLTAADVQERFDQWDAGETMGPLGRYHVDLETLMREWDEANLALLLYVQMHHSEIVKEIVAK